MKKKKWNLFLLCLLLFRFSNSTFPLDIQIPCEDQCLNPQTSPEARLLGFKKKHRSSPGIWRIWESIWVVATQIFFYVQSEPWGNHNPIWWEHMFQIGWWKTHQPTSMEFLGMVTSGGKFGLKTGDLLGSNPPRYSSPRRNGEGKEIQKIRTEEDSVRGSSPWRFRSHELRNHHHVSFVAFFFNCRESFICCCLVKMFLFEQTWFLPSFFWWHWCCLLKVRAGSIVF